MANILLAEDEKNIASFIERGLREFGHDVSTCGDGEAAWERLEREAFDIIILDIIMPRMNGLDLCRRYRTSKGYATPIIMLTALGSTDDIVRGLDAGADDYLVKPFSFAELQARISALLRSAVRRGDQPATGFLEFADLKLNVYTHQAERGGKAIELTMKEYRLLEYFIQHKGEAIPRLTLLKDVWDKNFDTNTNVVDVYVNYLRNKIDRGFDRKLIHTIVGIGYILRSEE